MLGHYLENNPREIYRVSVIENVITFTVASTLVEDIIKKVTREEVISQFLAIDRKKDGETFNFSVELPFITFPNYAHKGIDWKVLGECAEKISLLLSLFTMYLEKTEVNEHFCLSQNPQLMLIATSYSKTRDMHACPMEVGFSDDIAKKLADKYQKETSIDIASHEAMLVYIKLSSKTKREFERGLNEMSQRYGGMFGVVVKVRDCGVPQFSVPGNCACLGENPDTFSYSRGMYSHNLDTVLQQMTMLVAVVSFWNNILKPLSE